LGKNQEALMRSVAILATMCVVIGGNVLFRSASAQPSERVTEKRFILRPIGLVHKENGRTTLSLNEDVEPALRGLDGFSHVWVLWWFDRNDTPKKRSILQVHPRRSTKYPLTGVFACRAPVRPNPVALTLCRVVAVKGNLVEVDKIDAFPNTPIVDIKPYVPACDSAKASIPDWLKRRREGD